MKNLFIGIDFSKEKIDATMISAIGLVEQSARVSCEFKTTTSGYRQFLKWVEEHSNGIDVSSWLFCGENTGDYSKPLCNYLYGKGYDMWLENAKCIKDASGLRRLKTDRADSAMIAEYAMRNHDRAQYYRPLSSSLSQLRELFLYRHMIVRHKCSFLVRKEEKRQMMEKSPSRTMISNIGKHLITEFDKAIAKLDKKIKEIIEADEELLETIGVIESEIRQVSGIEQVRARLHDDTIRVQTSEKEIPLMMEHLREIEGICKKRGFGTEPVRTGYEG